MLSRGDDISNAKQLYEKVRENTTIPMYYIEESDIEALGNKIINNVQVNKIPGILKTHQIISLEKESFVYERQFSCFCKKLPVIDNCFNLRKIQILQEVVPNNDIDLSTNKWVMVRYDGKLFPGVVCGVSSQATADYEIKALKNKYIWPLPEVKIWYCKSDIMFNILPPTNVTKRLLSLDAKDWKLINSYKQQIE